MSENSAHVHVYTGKGKGKTTAALGLAFRASGHGMKVYFGQFMKGRRCCEHKAAESNPLITMELYGEPGCFRKKEVTEKHREQAENGLKKARNAIDSGQYKLVVLDEINTAVSFGLIDPAKVLEIMELCRKRGIELVLTGRNADRKIIGEADLVTEMKQIKHYFEKGVQARKGIEF